MNLTKTNKLILATFAFLAVLAFGGGRAHAATLTVVAGTDTVATNSSCSLSEAIENINDQAATNSDCAAGDGNNDTIHIQAGTVTLTDNLPTITEPVTIAGAGMGQTTVSGDAGQYDGFIANSLGATFDVTLKDMKITAYGGSAIQMVDVNTTLRNIEVDGQDAALSSDKPVGVFGGQSSQLTVDADNLYIHDINGNNGLYGFYINAANNTAVNADLNSITLADIHGSGAHPTFGVIMLATGSGSVTSTITNTTVDDVTGDDLVAPFGSFGVAASGNVAVTTSVQNITITGTRGFTGTDSAAGVKSAAFYAAAASFQVGSHVNVAVSVTNSLMADNTNDGVSSNCSIANITDIFGGNGTEDDVETSITSLGHNISDDDSCTGFNQSGDRQNISSILSTLGPLQNNGGAVPTRALLAGSPAIAAGKSVLGITTDARGIARNSCPSVGAYQFEGAVCAAATADDPTPSAPNTGTGAVSPAMTIIATSLGLGIIAYALRKRNAVK